MPANELLRKIWNRPTGLLSSAAAIAAVSLFFEPVIRPQRLFAQVVLGYIPVLLGCISMWLCIRASKRSNHKRIVFLYAIVLAPFAFAYPVWWALLYIAYVTGRYNGPTP